MEKFKQIFKNLLKTSFTKDDFAQLTYACKNNNLKIISDLFTIKKIGYTYGASLEIIFSHACENGNIDIVEYLLTSDNTKKSFHNMHVKSSYWITPTCQNGQFNIVEYLFTSPNLKEHTDIHKSNDKAFIAACDGLHLNLIKFLTSSPKLKEHANIYARNDAGFISVCNDYIKVMNTDAENRKFLNNPAMSQSYKADSYSEPERIKDIIDYFILELKIPQSEEIKNFLQKKIKEQDNIAKEISIMFDYRDLNNSLNQEHNPLSNISRPKKTKL